MKRIIKALRNLGNWLLCAGIGITIGLVARRLPHEKEEQKSFKNPNYRPPHYEEKEK